MAAGLASQRWRTLSLVFLVPGILPLLLGLVLYRASLLLAAGETTGGVVVLLDAAVRMLALAAGVLLGELLVSRLRPR
ncbi:MAG: threonine/serine exporter family protein [Jiangellales bacterium]